MSISHPETPDDRRDNQILWLLRGEARHMKVGPVSLFELTNPSCPTTAGYLYLTNYRVVFIPSTHDCLLPNGQPFISIPVRTVSASKRFSFGSDRHEIVVTTRLLRQIKILFDRQETECTVLQALLERIISADSFSRWFAFDYNLTPPATDPEPIFNQWRCYEPREEFARMGVTAESTDWRLVPNEQYALCETYPSLVCVPHAATDQLLSAVTTFRSRRRFPVLCWRKPGSSAAMFRSAQPLVGIVNWSDDDQFMMQLIKRSNPDSKWVYIFDARPKVNAVGNRVAGAGYERSYDNCKVQFQNIENIHEVQASFDRLFNLISKTAMQETSQDSSWFSGLESTSWLNHIQKIISASMYMVDIMDGRKQSSILVHCSDGWDRTSQMCSLAQLMMDPYYRTIRGFAVLIEKEWLSFGHRFAERCFGMHKEGSLKSSCVSPVFLQFLDCVWQLKSQFPMSFEFNTQFLLALLDAVYDCKYGNFLLNSEKERMEQRLHTRTEALWPELFKRAELVEPLYQRNPQTLRPVNSLKKLRLWEDAYLRWDFGLRRKESVEDQVRQLVEQRAELQAKLQLLQVQLRNMSRPDAAAVDRASTSDERRAAAEAEALAAVEYILEQTYESIGALWSKRHEELGSRKASKHTSFYLPKWVPDESATHCHHCRSAFTLIRRKHHCRSCGDIFCDACSGHQRPIPRMNFFTPVRICIDCNKQLDKEEQMRPRTPKKEFQIAIDSRELGRFPSRGENHERSFSLPPHALRRLTLMASGPAALGGHRTALDLASAGVG